MPCFFSLFYNNIVIVICLMLIIIIKNLAFKLENQGKTISI